jgi:hypothetical protein
MIFYHGTSAENARSIEREGFKFGKSFNWDVHTAKGFVSLSISYAPFYAMNASDASELALIKCEVDTRDLYPEDEDGNVALAKPRYSQDDLDVVDFEKYKKLWRQSLQYMGNVNVKPNRIRIVGIKYFDGSRLLYKIDPVITPMNFKICGHYYQKLTEHVFDSGEFMDFPSMFDYDKVKSNG